MGCTSSIPVNHKHKVKGLPEVRIPYTMEDNDNLQVLNAEDYDQKAIAQLKRDFQENLDVFLLNNILMAVMFFENFDKEMQKAKSTISVEGQEMSRILITNHHKQCTMPDTAAEIVNHRVRYRRKTNKGNITEESIITQRMYVTYDTIEILKEDEDLDHYSGIDKPTDRAHVVKSDHHGFVKLKHPKTQSCIDANNYTVSSSPVYSNGVDRPTPSPDLSEASTSQSGSDYLYIRINEMNDLQQLTQTRSSSNSSGAPINCLRPIKSRNFDETDNLYIIHNYYDSTAFMMHFKEQVFPGELAESLGFDRDKISNAKHNARAIYCDTDHERNGSVSYEIVPAVVNPWPGLNMWASRQRPIVRDKWKGIAYVWPTPSMIQEMIIFPAALVPRGYAPKRGQNTDYNLEWEVSYPKAEKYMHMRMSHAQMKCYLFFAILHKTFIETISQRQGILFDHFRTLMYWECEKNYRDWPENRLGEKMLRIMKTLKESMGRHELKDFFIENKNILENVPGPLLRAAQEKIHHIMERPVGHFIYALRNLTYSGSRFYPMFDFDELYKILNTNDSLVMINPMIYQAHRTEIELAKPNTDEQRWAQKKMILNRRRQQKELEQNLRNQPVPEPEKDEIDLKWTSRSFKPDMTKSVMFINLFVQHFLKIAEKSMKYHGATSQALFYLKHSWYLTKVMEDSSVGGDLFVKELQEKIKKLEELYEETFTGGTITIPTTPARNSMGFQHQLVKNMAVDLNNVSQQFQKGFDKNSDAKRRTTKVRINPTIELV